MRNCARTGTGDRGGQPVLPGYFRSGGQCLINGAVALEYEHCTSAITIAVFNHLAPGTRQVGEGRALVSLEHFRRVSFSRPRGRAEHDVRRVT